MKPRTDTGERYTYSDNGATGFVKDNNHATNLFIISGNGKAAREFLKQAVKLMNEMED